MTDCALLEDDAWRKLATCPAESLPWVALAFWAGQQQSVHAMFRDLAVAGQNAAPQARDVLKQPSWDELRGRRKPDHAPCPARCDRCSRCVHAEAWQRRGGRPFMGVEAERLIAEAQTAS